MNKVMLSIRSEWVNKILDGKKTIEVRKNRPRPKMNGPIKCYIYETKGLVKSEDGRYHTGRGRGAVVAEFVCSTIDEYVIVGGMQGDRVWQNLETLKTELMDEDYTAIVDPEADVSPMAAANGLAWLDGDEAVLVVRATHKDDGLMERLDGFRWVR